MQSDYTSRDKQTVWFQTHKITCTEKKKCFFCISFKNSKPISSGITSIGTLY